MGNFMFPWGNHPQNFMVTLVSVRVMCPNRKWIDPQTKIWEGAEVPEIIMHCRA